MNASRFPLLALFSLFLLFTTPSAFGQLSQTKIVPADVMEDDQFGGAISVDGNRFVVGVRLADLINDPNAGAAYVFEKIDGQWREVQKITASNADERDFFGESVALLGEWLFVGALGNDDREQEGGAVYVFRLIDGQWQEVDILYPDDPQDFHGFGWEIAFDGERLFISAPQDEEIAIQAGAVYRFALVGDAWQQQEKILPTSNNVADISFFGTAMGLDDDYLLVSSPTDSEADERAGAAYVFKENRGQWEQTQKLLPPPVALPDSLDSDTFSRELALEGEWALIGSSDDEVCIEKGDLIDPSRPNACTSGAVFAFQRQANGQFTFQQKIAPDELEQFDFFGFLAIAIEDGRAVIGTRGDDDACPEPPPPVPLFCDPGAVYLYELMDDVWEKTGKLVAADADSLDFLGGVLFGQGRPLGISGSHVVAGAPTIGAGFSEEISGEGKAYVFKIFNQDPVAQDDAASTSAGGTVEIDVLANDSDPDADALTLSIVAPPSNGATMVDNGTISYAANAGFSGQDTFTYQVDDGDGGTDEATVTVNVSSSNAPPVVDNPIDDVSLIAGGAVFALDLNTVFSDADGDALTFSASSSAEAFATATVAGSTLTVTPLDVGDVTITVSAEDGNGGSASTAFDVTIPTGIAVEPGDGVPAVFQLYANYPNPFNPATEITFDLPQTTHARLAVFDVLGRPVAVLVDRPMPAGRHAVLFDAEDWPSGVYVYRLDAGDYARARTMMLVK